ncbi:hypothetical protein FB451DRAFT_181491 [Mycena latifolia]|nr:hypothetical protein FB451DRAFT_186075 [Mycena latifolia]KAJ7437051.1 hypothetical protein FB451DRAFT_181491 [Mycena latifolia]
MSHSAELVSLLRLINPDFLSWGFISEKIDQQINRLLIWLNTWEGYRFMHFYEASNCRIRDALLEARDALAPRRSDCEVLAPSLQMLHAFQVEMNGSLQVILEAFRERLSLCPALIRIFQARRLLSPDRSYLSPSFCVGFFHVRILLDLSWDDMRAYVCSLRPIVGREFQNICTLLMLLPTLYRELNALYPEPLVSRDLACGFLRLMRRIGDGDLPMMFWRYFMHPSGHCLEWGRHIRSSPQSSHELLRELRQFVPPWDVFGCHLCPNDFYDVVQWLKTFPAPSLELIGRWQDYLTESMHRIATKYSDEELEERWRDNLALS